MSRAELIYPLHKMIERQLSKIQNDRYNRDILTRYYKVRSGQVSLVSIYNELNRLNIMSKIIKKKFEKATMGDIENLVFEIDKRCKKPSTVNKHRKILKRFYQWLKGHQPKDFPPEVKWIRMKEEPLLAVTENDLISYDECIRITECTSTLRDKALFQCKLDAGCRIGEILTVRMGEVEFNEAGAILQSDGKTGKAPLILTWSAKTLAMWINTHPFRDDPKAPLWPLLQRDSPIQMSYAAAHRAFMKCVKKSGCKKRVWLHLFKHVSSSYDSEIGLPESYRKFKHHWTPNSKMTRVYEHLTASIIPKIQLESMRLMNHEIDETKIQATKQTVQLFKKCNRCEFENPRDSRFCNRCAFPLKEREQFEKSMEQIKLDTVINKIRNDPEKLEKIISMIG